MENNPESPSKTNWESVAPKRRETASMTEEDKTKLVEKTIEFRKKLNSTKSSEDLTLASRLEARLTLGRSRSVSPRATPPFVDLIASSAHRSNSLNESSRNTPLFEESDTNNVADFNRRHGRPRATNAFSGNEPPPILNVDSNRRSSSFTKLKREERLKNLRKSSLSLPSFLMGSASPPPSPGSGESDLDKKKGASGWSRRFSRVWNTIAVKDDSVTQQIEHLKSPNRTLEQIHLLRDKIEQSPKWLIKFLESDGLEILEKLVAEDGKTGLSYDDIPKRKELLHCLKAILAKNLPLKEIIVNQQGNNILQSVVPNMVHKDLIEAVIEVLEVVAQYSDGGEFVLSALEFYQTQHGKRSKFEDLVKQFDKEDYNLDVKVLSLINHLLNNTEDLSIRIEFHNDLLSLGIVPHILTLRRVDREDLQIQLDAFEEAMQDDHAEVAQEDPGIDVDPENPNRLRVEVTLTTISVTCLFQYDETTRTSDVIRNIKAKFPTTDFADYGLVFAFSVWLDEDRTLQSCGLEGEEILEYKMNPWLLPITDAATGKEIKIRFDPNDIGAELVANVMKKFDVKPDEEYGIIIIPKNEPEKAEWLQDTKNLINYRTIKDEVTILFRTKPKLVTVRYLDNSTDSIMVDMEHTVKQVLLEILKKRNIAENLVDEYCLTLQDSNNSQPLQCDTKMNTYAISEGSVMLLTNRTYPLTIVTRDSEIVVEVSWSSRVSDVLVDICDKLQLEYQRHFLQKETNDNGKSKIRLRIILTVLATLFPWNSLRDNHVNVGSKVFLVKKGAALGQSSAQANQEERCLSIWEEPPRDPERKGFTLNGLVIQLSTEKDYDVSFLKIFLWTYESFTTSEQLALKLMERYRVPLEVPEYERKLIQMRVCTVFKHWLEMHYELGEVMEMILDFVDNEMTQKELEGIVGRLKKAISHKKSAESKKYIYTEKPADPILPKSPPATPFDADPLEIARQLSLQTFDIFSSIQPSELFHQAWLNPKLQHKAPNILKLIASFNYVANWVSTSIVSESKVKNRAKIFSKHIKLAQALLQLQNFHMLMAVVSGLNNSAVLRLKWTKSKMNKRYEQIFIDIEKLCSMEGSWKAIRTAITMAVPPRIPYIGIYLADLLFIDEGNPDFVEEHLINFEKRKLVHQILQKIEESQKIGYNFVRVPDIEKVLQELPQSDEKDMYAKSLICEPRNSTKKDIA